MSVRIVIIIANIGSIWSLSSSVSYNVDDSRIVRIMTTVGMVCA